MNVESIKQETNRRPIQIAMFGGAVLLLLVAAFLWGAPLRGETDLAPSANLNTVAVGEDFQRSGAAADARFAAMDARYGATTGENLQRSRAAAEARSTAMDVFYGATTR